MSTVAVSRTIAAPVDRVWEVFTNIERAADMVSGIERVEVLSDVPFGAGFRWRETRRMLGQSATEEMWVTNAEQPRFFEAAAASRGTRYLSRYEFAAVPGGTEVRLTFAGTPENPLTRTMDVTMGWALKGTMAKQVRKDLDELAAVCEAG